MSKVLSKEVKEVVTAKVRMLEGIRCDSCGKIIPADKHYATPMCRYYGVTTGHHDWGNDSFDSREDYDICPDCISKFVDDYLGSDRDYNDTKYIEINTKYCYEREVRE